MARGSLCIDPFISKTPSIQYGLLPSVFQFKLYATVYPLSFCLRLVLFLYNNFPLFVGDYDRPLRIEVFDMDNDGSHDDMGRTETNVRQLLHQGTIPITKQT